MPMSTGSTARARITTPRRLPVEQLRFVLNDPPEGIAIENVSADGRGVDIVLRADAEKIEPGAKGNLIVDVFLERPAQRGNAKQRGRNRRVPLGSLPAISYRITSPDATQPGPES